MKKVFAVLMCVVILCMTMCITAFAAETESDLVPDGAEIIQDGQYFEAGKTYYVVWMPYGAYSGGGFQCLEAVCVNGDLLSCSAKFNIFSSLSNITTWYGGSNSASNNAIVSVNSGYAWDESCFVFPDIDASRVERNKYYTVQFTVPSDGKNYQLKKVDDSKYSAEVYTYTPCEHVYSNTCDTHCDKCNYERSITHTYINDNDHNCSVCGFTNTNPTHVYDGDKDYTCNYCDYKRPQPRVWENLTGLSAFVIAIVVELATAITKSPLMLLAIVGIPCVGLGAGILRRLFSQRV